jgi:hypothetical protein
VDLRSIITAASILGEEPTSGTPLSTTKTVVDIINTSVTALAIVVGGIWAYFKFVKGRTYRMRTQTNLSGEWRLLNGRHLLHVQITVKNIGASKVKLTQEGTGLRVKILPSSTTMEDRGPVSWRRFGTFEVLLEHEWIEPEETISDELLISLSELGPQSVLLEVRLVLDRQWPAKNTETFARIFVPCSSSIGAKQETKALRTSTPTSTEE